MKHLNILIIGLILLSSCSEDQKLVNMAIKRDGKTYLFTAMNKEIVASQLAQGDMLALINSTAIVANGKKLFMDAEKIGELANVLGGNIIFFDKPQQSFEGYFTVGDSPVGSQEFRNQDTGKIGEIAGIQEIELRNGRATYFISYQITPKLKAMKNCEVMSLTVRYSENSSNEFTSKDFVMVNLDDINRFFGNKYALTFDINASILFLEDLSNN